MGLREYVVTTVVMSISWHYNEAEDHGCNSIPEDYGIDGDGKGEEALIGACLFFPGGDQGADRRCYKEDKHGKETRKKEAEIEPLAQVKGKEHEEWKEEAEYLPPVHRKGDPVQGGHLPKSLGESLDLDNGFGCCIHRV